LGSILKFIGRAGKCDLFAHVHPTASAAAQVRRQVKPEERRSGFAWLRFCLASLGGYVLIVAAFVFGQNRRYSIADMVEIDENLIQSDKS
jgi:hypothetical protein